MAASKKSDSDDTRVPVTILTGFLGSGKTTLLNHLLTQDHGKKLAIIENEFGEVGIDDALLAKNTKMQSDEQIIEMMNGCICCTVRQDLVVVLDKLATRISSGSLTLDAIIIETTGMADPAPVAQTFFVEENVAKKFRLDGIVTVVDAKHIEQHLDEVKPEGAENEAIEQVAFADRLMLNKTDLASEEDLTRIEARLKSINSFAPIKRSCQSKVNVDAVLDLRAFDLKRTLEMDDGFLDTDAEHVHDDTISSVSLTHVGMMDLELIESWMGNLLREKGADIYRMKGVMAIAGVKRKFVFQGVHMIFDGTFDQEELWKEDEEKKNMLVFIGKNLNEEELKSGFLACVDDPEARKKKAKLLRFAVGDKVMCNAEGGWQTGTIVKLFYRTGMPSLPVAPYQIQLDAGPLIYAPIDDDRVIKRAS